jgi:hypothetical protein
MPDHRETRIAENEVLFREVNERRVADQPDLVELTCECGRIDCHQQVRLEPGEYRAIRADPRRFFVLPGHEIEDVESVVERREGHWVIEKPAEVDPIVGA